jgi:hypothetical protein
MKEEKKEEKKRLKKMFSEMIIIGYSSIIDVKSILRR